MSKWRDKYKIHLDADVFPMMSDEELAKLGEDIKANGLKTPITFWDSEKGTPRCERFLIDGRNRLEAMERVGLNLNTIGSTHRGRQHGKEHRNFIERDPISHIISLNIHRRHLNKQQQADLIVAAHKAAADKPRQVGEVSKGGRGKADKLKAAAVETAKAHGIGKRMVERSFAKVEGKKPNLTLEQHAERINTATAEWQSNRTKMVGLITELRDYFGDDIAFKASLMGKPLELGEEAAVAVIALIDHGTPEDWDDALISAMGRAFATEESTTRKGSSKPKAKSWKSQQVCSGLDAARRAYFKWCVELDADLDAELDAVRAAFQAIARKRRRP